jgi:predicted deacylase
MALLLVAAVPLAASESAPTPAPNDPALVATIDTAAASEISVADTIANEAASSDSTATAIEPPASETPASETATTEKAAGKSSSAAVAPEPVVEAGEPAADPAPIIEPPPPQRAENVNLRDVVTTPISDEQTLLPATPARRRPPALSPVEGTPPLVLLGSEVPPGTAARLAWSPSESFAGIAAPTPVLVINGANPGPVLCLTAAIHGDELIGIEVVRRVLYSIDASQLSGALIGVPIVNLQGFRRSSRYLPDRRDLNRYFPGNTYGSSASRIAYSFFNEIVLRCDALVDLHTGSFHRTNLPQVRGDLNNPDVAALANGFGGMAVLQSRGARGSLRRAAVEAGIPSVTVEAGEPMRLDEVAVEQGVRSIERLLDSLGMLKMRSRWSKREQPIFYKSTWVRANEGGVLFSKVQLGQRVRAGDLLGTVTDPITNAQHDILSPYTGRVIGMALNQVMMPGFAAYHIGIQSTVEEAAEPDPTLDTAIDEFDDEDAELMPEPSPATGELPPAGAAAESPTERAE